MGPKSLDLIHKYTNSQLIFDLVKVAAKTKTQDIDTWFVWLPAATVLELQL
jgi:hypothetical protein